VCRRRRKNQVTVKQRKKKNMGEERIKIILKTRSHKEKQVEIYKGRK
jgi:hypothetical protein